MHTPGQVLMEYVRRHNVGVSSADFCPLLSLFAPTATMRFHGIRFGPLEGQPALATAFREHPPTDRLVIGILEESSDVEAEAPFAWASELNVTAGLLRVKVMDGVIHDMEVSITAPPSTDQVEDIT